LLGSRWRLACAACERTVQADETMVLTAGECHDSSKSQRFSGI
jgi:hypothetical protein